MSIGWDIETAAPQEPDDYPLCPQGTFPAAVVGVIEVGTHTEDTDYGEADRRKLAIVYELAVPKPDGTPFLFAEYLTFSRYNNSNLHKRYAALVGAPPLGASLNPTHLLGRPCAVSIVHREGGKRQIRTYANLSDVIPPMYGQPPYQAQRQPVCWGTFEGTPPPDLSWVPSIFGKSLRSLIEASHEARAGKFPLGAQANQRQPQQQQRTSQQQPTPQPQYTQQPQQQPQHHQQPQAQPQQYQQPQQQQPQSSYHQQLNQLAQHNQQAPPQQQQAPAQPAAADDDIPF